MIVVYPFIYEHVIFIVNFNSKYSLSIDRTLFYLDIYFLIAWIAQQIRRVIHIKCIACMLFFSSFVFG